MARKRFLVSSAGGIGAGAPFGTPALGGFLYVEQISPPIASSSRMRQIFPLDATESIIAPGTGAGANSLVIGQGSTQNASTRAVLLGRSLVGATLSAGDDQIILIGDGISLAPGAGAQDGIIAIGSDMVLLASSGQSVLIGVDLTLTTAVSHAGTVLIGNGATSDAGFSVGVGQACQVGSSSVAVGKDARATATSVAIGAGTRSNDDAVRIGRQGHVVQTGVRAVSIGYQNLTVTSGADAVSVGYEANATFAGSIAIGVNTSVFAIGDLCIGTNQSGGTLPISRVIIGPNIDTNAVYPGLQFWFTSATTGVNNKAAPSTTFCAGQNTGTNATGGRIIFTTGTIQVSGSTYQGQVERFAIAAGGVAGTPSIQFTNQISTPGVGAGTLTNAPAAGDPVIWAEVLYNGTLRYIPMW